MTRIKLKELGPAPAGIDDDIWQRAIVIVAEMNVDWSDDGRCGRDLERAREAEAVLSIAEAIQAERKAKSVWIANSASVVQRLRNPSPEMMKLVLANLPSEYDLAYEDDRDFRSTRHLLSVLADHLAE